MSDKPRNPSPMKDGGYIGAVVAIVGALCGMIGVHVAHTDLVTTVGTAGAIVGGIVAWTHRFLARRN